MEKCHICNNFEGGQGAKLPFKIWVADALSSPCRYCQLLIKAINALDTEFLSEEQQKHQFGRSDTESSVAVRVSISDQSKIYLHSYYDGWSRVEISLEFFRSADAHHDPEACAIGTFRPPVRGEIAPLPGDPTMWTFLCSTLQTCLKEHSTCRNAQDPMWFPERLLSIQPICEEKTIVRLIETQHQRPESAYVALSHCWGSQRFVCTTSENIQSHQKTIDSSTLPRTFQDAITVAQELGVSYIWIDSLCIIQDNEDDWARHAERMDKIYENALFVVAATSSSNGSVPFLGPDAPTNRQSYCAVDIKLSNKDNACIDSSIVATKARKLHPWLYPGYIHGPLEERAWAMQERYCAVRIISFTEEEVKWQCRESRGCECHGALATRESFDIEWQLPEQKDLSDEGAIILDKWRDVVQEYAPRNLSYSTDRLPAIAGIASRFHSLLQSNYIAGLWQVEIPFNLGWFRRELTDSPNYFPLIPPSMESGVPTWSWASNFAACHWLWEHYFEPSGDADKRPELQLMSNVEVTQINCVPSTSNAFGALESGSFIELRGRMVPAVMESDAYGCASVQRDGFAPQLVILDCKTAPVMEPMGTSKLGEMQRDLNLDDAHNQSRTYRAERNPNTRNRGNVSCLLLYTGICEGESRPCILILGQVTGADSTVFQRLGLGCGLFADWSGPLYYRRKGWPLWQGWEDLQQWEEWEKWFSDAEVGVVRIV